MKSGFVWRVNTQLARNKGIAVILALFLATNYMFGIVNPAIYLIILLMLVTGTKPLGLNLSTHSLLLIALVIVVIHGGIVSPVGSSGLVYALTMCFMLLLILRSNCNCEWAEYLPKTLLAATGVHVFFVLLYPVLPGAVQFVASWVLSYEDYQRNLMEWYRNGINCGITGIQSLAAFYVTVFMSVVFAMYFSKNCRTRMRTNLALFFYLLAFVAVLLTSKRGTMLANVCALVVTAVFLSKDIKKRLKYLAGLLLALLLTYAALSVWFPDALDIFERFTKQQDTTTGRLDIYLSVLQSIGAHPLIGEGNLASAVLLEGNYAHNIYLQLLYENGVLGLVCFLIFAGYCFVRTIWDYHHVQSPKGHLYIAISFYFQVFFLAYGVVGNPLFDYTILFTYFCMLVLAQYGSRVQESVEI